MSDSISETLNMRHVFDIIQGLPVENVDPLTLIVMEPDCLVRKSPSGRLAKSVANFGICSPILVNCNNLVLDGKKRLEIAMSVGMKSVPVKKLNVPMSPDGCMSVRAISNPESKPSRFFGDIFVRKLGNLAKIPVKPAIERAKRTVNSRSRIDIRLQKENKIYEASLAQAAMHAVNSIGCIDAIIRNSKGRQDYLEKARKLLEKSIRYTVYSGFTKEKKIVSPNHEHRAKDSKEEKESDSQNNGSGVLELHEDGSDLRHAMRGFGAFPGLQLQ